MVRAVYPMSASRRCYRIVVGRDGAAVVYQKKKARYVFCDVFPKRKVDEVERRLSKGFCLRLVTTHYHTVCVFQGTKEASYEPIF